MKKLMLAAALTLGGVAFATEAANDDLSKRPQERASDTSAKVDATEVGPAIGEAAKDVGQTVGLETEKDGTFKVSKAFDIKGKLEDPSMGRVTIAREGLPDASLDLRDETIVMLDGKKVEASALPEGAEVRAKFQLEGKESVALKLEAKSPKDDKKPLKKK